MTDRLINPHDHPDVKYLMDLLELLDWEKQPDANWIPREWQDFQAGLDEKSWTLLNNSGYDYGPIVDGDPDWSTVARMCWYVLGIFDGEYPDTWKVVGDRLGRTLLIETGSVLGRRWCEDITATAWRITVAHNAAEVRLAR